VSNELAIIPQRPKRSCAVESDVHFQLLMFNLDSSRCL